MGWGYGCLEFKLGAWGALSSGGPGTHGSVISLQVLPVRLKGLLHQGGQPVAVRARVAGTAAGLVAAARSCKTPVDRKCCFLHCCKAAALRDLGSASLPPSKTRAERLNVDGVDDVLRRLKT